LHQYLLPFLILCSLTLWSCDDEEVVSGDQDYAYELVQTGYHYIEGDSTIGEVPYFSTVTTVSDTDYISILNSIRNSIDLFPIREGVAKSIPIDEVAFGALKSYSISNWDSIFIHVRGPRSIHPNRDAELFIINAQGELVKKLEYADKINLFDRSNEVQSPMAETILNNQWDPIAVAGSHLIFGLLPYQRDSLVGKKALSAQMELGTGELSKHPLHMDVFAANSVLLYQNPIKHVDARHNRVLFGLRGTPSLQILDLQDYTQRNPTTHTIESDFLKMPHPPSHQEIASNPAHKSMLQVIGNWGEYGKILQTPDDFYLRFVYYAKQDSIFEATYGNGKTSSMNNRLCSVVLFDKNFQKQGESGTFEGLSDKNAGISQDGTLYVLDYNGDDPDENRIRYATFKVEKVTPMQNES